MEGGAIEQIGRAGSLVRFHFLQDGLLPLGLDFILGLLGGQGYDRFHLAFGHIGVLRGDGGGVHVAAAAHGVAAQSSRLFNHDDACALFGSGHRSGHASAAAAQDDYIGGLINLLGGNFPISAGMRAMGASPMPGVSV